MDFKNSDGKTRCGSGKISKKKLKTRNLSVETTSLVVRLKAGGVIVCRRTFRH